MRDKDIGGDTQLEGPHYVLARSGLTGEMEIESGWRELVDAWERFDELAVDEDGVRLVKLIGKPSGQRGRRGGKARAATVTWRKHPGGWRAAHRGHTLFVRVAGGEHEWGVFKGERFVAAGGAEGGLRGAQREAVKAVNEDARGYRLRRRGGKPRAGGGLAATVMKLTRRGG